MSQKKGKKSVIFIVEDDVLLVKAYQAKFEKEKAEVWVASDGKEAFSFLKKETPNIVLLDLMLPGASGFDILEAIRKNDKWKKVPVIVLTNLGQLQDVERCKALGIDDYIVKANSKISDVAEKVKKYI
ncbi:MAG: response regulator [Patescibacteria group bacterium]